MGEKKVKGCKRQNRRGQRWASFTKWLVHRANIHDSKGGAVLADIVLKQQRQVKKVLADLGYRGFFEERVTLMHKRFVEFSTKITGEFVIQAERWIVEPAIAWLNWARR